MNSLMMEAIERVPRMGDAVYCHGCGQRLELPDGFARPQFRCTACGSLNETPRNITVKIPAAAAPTVPPEPEVLLRGTEEDDFNPYSVRGDVPAGTCPECGQAIHLHVTLCCHCGVDLAARQLAKRTFAPVDRTWEIGWPFSKRLALFLILQAVNAAVLITGLMAGWSTGLAFGGTAVPVLLQTFLLGTYDRIRLTRNAKGKVTLTRTWRYGFVARPAKSIPWKEHEGLRVIMTDETEPFDWMIVAWLAFCGIVPGVVFWWLALRGERYLIALCKDHGFPDNIIFRTRHKQRAQEITSIISEVAVLPILK